MTDTKTQTTVERIADLLEQYFDGEVYEVAMYALQREVVADITEDAIHAGLTNVPNVPPETVRTLLDAEDGLVGNTFYQQNYAPIRTAMTLSAIKIQTKAFHLDLAVEGNNPHSADIVRALDQGYADVLTIVATLALGRVVASEFDKKMRTVVAEGLSPATQILAERA